MHDAFLKSVFADRRMVEILIHGHAPEWAAKMDELVQRERAPRDPTGSATGHGRGVHSSSGCG